MSGRIGFVTLCYHFYTRTSRLSMKYYFVEKKEKAPSDLTNVEYGHYFYFFKIK